MKNAYLKDKYQHSMSSLMGECKIPPQALDFEEAVLGAIMLEKEAIFQVINILKPESFYMDQHQKIFQAIVDLISENKAIDMLTVTEELRKNKLLDEVGGPLYLAHLTSIVASASHVGMHSRILQDKFISRELIRISTEMQSMAFDEREDPLDIISRFQSNVNNLLSENQVGNAESIQSIQKRRIKEIEIISKSESKIIGIPSGLTLLDRQTGGWQNSDLVIIAARPAMGKTAFALNCALQAAYHHFPVAFFSLEMSKSQLYDRALSATTDLSPIIIRTGKMNWVELEIGVGKIENLEFYIDDTPSLKLTQLRASVTQLIRKYGIKMVVVDYLQLMNAKGEGYNRDQEIGYLSRGLKGLAKECNIPIIALSQLNRDAEGRRPGLSNLRESGNIEQDADIVILIHRPEKYGEEPKRSTKEMIELILSKHRNGPIGITECYVNDFCTQFADYQGELNPSKETQVQSFHEVHRTNTPF